MLLNVDEKMSRKMLFINKVLLKKVEENSMQKLPKIMIPIYLLPQELNGVQISYMEEFPKYPDFNRDLNVAVKNAVAEIAKQYGVTKYELTYRLS
jgi:hypothetical protein